MRRLVLVALVCGSAVAQTVDPLLNSFSRRPNVFTQQGGEALYRGICQACHMEGGQGASSGAGFFPDLRRNARLAAGAYPALVVLNGLHGMPPFGQQLDDSQVADVVNYVRTNFGNAYADAVTPHAVAALRGQRK